MRYLVLILSFFICFTNTQYAIGQSQEGISFDSTSKYYVITYCCDENGNLLKGTHIPGNLVDPEIKSSVQPASSSESFKYSYSVRNKETAPRLLYSFSIKRRAKIDNVKTPNGDWVNYSMPDTTISWRKSRSKIKGIKPDSEEIGFEFKSNGLPSLVNGFAASNTWTGFPDEGPTNAKLQKEFALLQKSTEHINIKIIAPRKLPDNISNTALVDTLQSYLTFSCDITWIENQGTCRSLEAKLDNVERQIDRNTNTATNNLQAFLNELDALKEKQISSEAYGLLYYNGQFLLEKLRE